MTFSAASLHAVLQAHTPAEATGLVVALSGGADSACLLAALKQIEAPAIHALPVRAIHIDHQLQPAAAEFRIACESVCRELEVPLCIEPVAVETAGGMSVEAAARDARYRGFARRMAAGECLLTAHHADDQAETVLLQLLRGAGLKGLSAMPLCREWNAGWHMRPLLGVRRHELRAFGAALGVAGVADPMNEDPRFDRAYLRRQVLPLIERRWPGAVSSLARSAGHFAEAQELLDLSVAQLLGRLRDGAALSLAGLRSLSPAEQTHVLRSWIAANGAPLPSASRLGEAKRQLLAAGADHLPAVEWGGHALRRYRDRLYLTAAAPPRLGEDLEWSTPSTVLGLGPGLGSLKWIARAGGLDPARLPDTMIVRRRRGGESLKPEPRGRTHSLRHLCQSIGVLPWLRGALPLIYAGAELVAVGDLWLDARWCVPEDVTGVACAWLDAPELV